MPTLSVVIPCYNESKNIPLILDRFSQVINRLDVELLLIDNGSTDDSPAVLQEHLPGYKFAATYRVPVNQGYGFGILQGLSQVASRSEFIGWTHADMQTDPADILRALEMIEKSAEPKRAYAKGLRHGRTFAENVFTCGMAVFETMLLQTSLWDINAQPNIFHHTFFESWKNPPHDFSLDLYAFYQARQQKLDVVRFDVKFPPRIYGESKWNTGIAARWKFIKRTLTFSFELKRRLDSTS
ncbi:MAG: glycosyltransferase family 2 protein [Terriglobales bacterium]